MSEINVKINVGHCRLFDLKVCVDLNDNVIALKKAICKIKDHIMMNSMTIMYCGNILSDESRALCTYELFSGATVHVFQQIRRENYEPYDEATIEKKAIIFRSRLESRPIRKLMKALCRPEEIHILLHNNPGLVDDPVALTLLQHPELLKKVNDDKIFRQLAIHHPALMQIILHTPKTILSQDERSEDLEDIPGDNSTHLLSTVRNSTAQESQPSTSRASTSTEDMENALENAQSHLTTTEHNLTPHFLQMLRGMGFTNETLNMAALELCDDINTALDFLNNVTFNEL